MKLSPQAIATHQAQFPNWTNSHERGGVMVREFVLRNLAQAMDRIYAERTVATKPAANAR